MPETVVHLVRHGQVENPRRVLYGRLPGYHLSRRGQAQADLLAGHFAGAPLAAVLASPLERAQQTATPIAAAHGLEVRTDLRLIETSNIFEGVAGNVAWYIVRHPRLWWKLRDLRAPSWGERNVDMVERVHAVVDAVREEFAGQPGRPRLPPGPHLGGPPRLRAAPPRPTGPAGAAAPWPASPPSPSPTTP